MGLSTTSLCYSGARYDCSSWAPQLHIIDLMGFLAYDLILTLTILHLANFIS